MQNCWANSRSRLLRRTHGVSLVGSAIQKDSVVLKYSSRGPTYIPYLRQSRCRERLPCRTTRQDTARVVLSAVCLCVPRNAGHVTERPRVIILAKNAVAGANYCCVRVGRTTPRHCLVNKRRGETIGTIRRGKSAIHFIAGPELGFIAWPTSATPIAAEQVSHNPCVMPFTFEATNRP